MGRTDIRCQELGPILFEATSYCSTGEKCVIFPYFTNLYDIYMISTIYLPQIYHNWVLSYLSYYPASILQNILGGVATVATVATYFVFLQISAGWRILSVEVGGLRLGAVGGGGAIGHTLRGLWTPGALHCVDALHAAASGAGPGKGWRWVSWKILEDLGISWKILIL